MIRLYDTMIKKHVASGLTLSDMGSMRMGGTMPGRGDMRPDRQNGTAPAVNSAGWLWILASVLVLGAGILIAKMYK